MSKKPTGITISRKDGKYTIKWKCGDKNYRDGQQFEYRLNGGKWHSKSIGTGARSKVLSFDLDDYYPNKNKNGKTIKKKLKSVGVRIRGKAKDGKWSGWESKTYHNGIPSIPSLDVALDDELTNKCKFTWRLTTSATDNAPFENVQWETMLVKDCDITEGKELDWNAEALGYETGTGSASSSKTITEETELLADGSYTRWFRVRSRGAGGRSKWRYGKHIYSRPYQTQIKDAVVTASNAEGLTCYVTWIADSKASHPIDSTTVQYLITVPTEGLTCPSGAQWNDANVSADTNESDAAKFSIDDVIDKDNCLFVRVNTIHDSNITYGIPKLAEGGVGALKNPTDLVYQTDNDDHTLTSVTVDNNSEVPDAHIAIVYRPGSDVDNEVVVGIILHDAVQPLVLPVQCPDWSQESEFSIGAYAFVGTYTPKTDAVGYDLSDVKMQSGTTWVGGAIPIAPSVVNVKPSESTGTVTVEWDWTWSDATRAQLSWTDHRDAWESTDEPQIYTINKSRPVKWNISGLEAGVKWWIAVRLVKGDPDGDDAIFGPWSEPVDITLSSVPNVPLLSVYPAVVTQDGEFTASWGFESTDGTGQKNAEICEAEETAPGVWRHGVYRLSKDTSVLVVDEEGTEHFNDKSYYEKTGDYDYEKIDNVPLNSNPADNGWYEFRQSIVTTNVAQEVAIKVSDLEWETGKTYNICVRVTSELDRTTDWSNPASIVVAEPVTCGITDTSLVYKDVEVNPRYFAGDEVNFDTEMPEDVVKLQTNIEPIQDGTPWNATTADITPYNFRKVPSVGHSINSEYDKIVGGTVAWNQLANNFQNRDALGLIITANNANGSIHISGTATATNSLYFRTDFVVHAGHKYFLRGSKGNGWLGLTNTAIRDTGNGAIIPYNTEFTRLQMIYGFTEGDVIDETLYPQIIDLTALFGNTTIADYIYSLEQSTAGAGVAWLKEHFPKMFNSGYIAYDAGTLKSVEGLQSHDTVGFNLWDEEVDLGILDSDGSILASSNRLVSKNFIPIIEGQTYYMTKYSVSSKGRGAFYDADYNLVKYLSNFPEGNLSVWTFTVPSGAAYVKFCLPPGYGTTYNNDICINISKTTGTPKNGDYVAYVKHTYALDSDLVLRGIPKLDASNNLYYDGDTYASDGSVTRKYGIRDLGSMNWSQYTDSSGNYPNLYQTAGLRGLIKNASSPTTPMANMLCTKYYPISGSGVVGWGGSAAMAVNQGGTLYISDPAYSDAASFKTAMSGVYLVYELATPTTETADPYTNPQVVDADGTEEYVTTSIVPVGHETYYADIYPISGYDEVNATIKGKNLVDWIITEQTFETSYNGFGQGKWQDKMPISNSWYGKTITYSAYIKAGLNGSQRVRVWFYKDGVYVPSFINGSAISANQSGISYAIIAIPDDGSVNEIAFGLAVSGSTASNPQVELGSSATDYEPYGNETYTAEFEDTVYGGTVDLVSGVLTVDRAIFEGQDVTWTASSSTVGRFIRTMPEALAMLVGKLATSSHFPTATNSLATTKGVYVNSTRQLLVTQDNITTIADWNVFLQTCESSGNPVQFTVPLATPQEIQLTPQQIQTLVGENYVSADAGSIEIRISESFRNALVLDKMSPENPFEIEISGGGDNITTTVAIERTDDYLMDRPDETQFDGFNEETVYLDSDLSIETVTINQGDEELIGRLDDGAPYKIVVTNQDVYGQMAKDELEFEVSWEHQARVPDATCVIDDENLVAVLTPVAPLGTLEGDTCDIYRLSADRPELIVKDAEFGTEYVDPYPTIGEFGGHRFVFKTFNGDYITPDNNIAWTDTGADEGDLLEIDRTIIDFDGKQLLLYYNVDVGHEWEKDFQETKYLGGSVQGDWNAAVSRSGSVSATMITITDQEQIRLLRELAVYTKPCHVRTKDGSSFTANVQVSEDREHEDYDKIASFSMEVTRIDPETLDGMTYEQWSEGN